jgi:hypothetical protein
MASGEGAIKDDAVMKVKPFPLSQVRLLDSRWKDEQERDRAYLLALDLDRLMYNFRKQAKLDAPGEPLGGWEAPTCEVRGHFVGHYLSACALMVASTGDAAVRDKGNAVVAELAKCQAAMGGEYLCAFPESLFDRVENQQPVWVPYYTLHKILAGLYDMYTLAGNEQALDMLKRGASYVKKRLDCLPADQIDRMLRTEFGGMAEVLHNLYGLTGDPQVFDTACKFDQPEFLGPLALSHDNLTRIHGNTNIPKIVGAARRYELTGDVRYRDLSMFFWDRVVNTRSYATGGSTMFECWPEPNKLAQTLGHLNHETCKTYNMLRLTRHILCWTADVKYADFYERALYSGILGTQGPQPGQLEYYVPMAAGYPRTFGTTDTAFWCCYGSGVENWAKLGDSIYFHNDNALYVNLFIPSTVQWPEKGLTLEQQTAFPRNDTTTCVTHLEKPAAVAVNMRIPYWATNGVEVRINGDPLTSDIVKNAKPASWLPLDRTWKDGDRVELRMPMSLHTMALPDDANTVAILYGPLVLAGVLYAREGQDVVVDGNHEAVAGCQQTDRLPWIAGDPMNPSAWLTPVPDKPLTFKSTGAPKEYLLEPFCDIAKERYAVYWNVAPADSPRGNALKEADRATARELDRVFLFTHPEAAKSEIDHQLKSEKSATGPVPGTAYVYRHAEPGGYFGWSFKVLPDQPAALRVTYFGGDVNRKFDIEVEGKLIATESLQPVKPGELREVEYALPIDLTRDKDHVSVVFRANHDTLAGGVFGCATLKSAL